MRSIALIAAVAGCSYMRHPSDATTWGKPTGTMVLGVEARGEVINAFVQNRGTRSQRVIAGGITVTIAQVGADGVPRQIAEIHSDAGPIRLDREESFETLAPGACLVRQIEIDKLRSGTYQATVSYRAITAQQGDWWSGTLAAGPIAIERP